jgi:hypothetical protein
VYRGRDKAEDRGTDRYQDIQSRERYWAIKSGIEEGIVERIDGR